MDQLREAEGELTRQRQHLGELIEQLGQLQDNITVEEFERNSFTSQSGEFVSTLLQHPIISRQAPGRIKLKKTTSIRELLDYLRAKYKLVGNISIYYTNNSNFTKRKLEPSETLESYGVGIGLQVEVDDEPEVLQQTHNAGYKRLSNKRQSNKRQSSKIQSSKRQSNKRQSSKRQSNKRQSNKRQSNKRQSNKRM